VATHQGDRAAELIARNRAVLARAIEAQQQAAAAVLRAEQMLLKAIATANKLQSAVQSNRRRTM
jgi:hypothetical protein